MSDCFTLGLACNTTHACNRSGCQLARSGRPVGAGEAPGHGLPDWPEDLRTFDERHAYQRGVTVGKLVGRTEVNDDLMAALGDAALKTPTGWSATRRDDGGIDIVAPGQGSAPLALFQSGGSHAEDLLFALADAMLKEKGQ